MDLSIVSQINFNNLTRQITTFCTAADKRLGKVENQIDDLQKAQKRTSNDVEGNTTEVKELKSKVSVLEKFVTQTKIDTINKDVHSRRYQLLFGNADDNGVWEKANDTEKLVKDILQKINTPVDDNDVDVWDHSSVVITKAHRLPRNPLNFDYVSENGHPRRRMIVAKFELMTDVNIILKKCRNLQNLNVGKRTHERIYIDRHLPKVLQEQKKKLKTTYDNMKKEGKKPRFKYDYEKAQMYLIDGKAQKNAR